MMKKIFCPSWDLNSRPSRSVDQQVFNQFIASNWHNLTAYEVNLNHQYLFIFSVDFHVFGHCSISIPHRSQKDPLYALAYFLVYFCQFSAMCTVKWKFFLIVTHTNSLTRQMLEICRYLHTHEYVYMLTDLTPF